MGKDNEMLLGLEHVGTDSENDFEEFKLPPPRSRKRNKNRKFLEAQVASGRSSLISLKCVAAFISLTLIISAALLCAFFILNTQKELNSLKEQMYSINMKLRRLPPSQAKYDDSELVAKVTKMRSAVNETKQKLNALKKQVDDMLKPDSGTSLPSTTLNTHRLQVLSKEFSSLQHGLTKAAATTNQLQSDNKKMTSSMADLKKDIFTEQSNQLLLINNNEKTHSDLEKKFLSEQMLLNQSLNNLKAQMENRKAEAVTKREDDSVQLDDHLLQSRIDQLNSTMSKLLKEQSNQLLLINNNEKTHSDLEKKFLSEQMLLNQTLNNLKAQMENRKAEAVTKREDDSVQPDDHLLQSRIDQLNSTMSKHLKEFNTTHLVMLQMINSIAVPTPSTFRNDTKNFITTDEFAKEKQWLMNKTFTIENITTALGQEIAEIRLANARLQSIENVTSLSMKEFMTVTDEKITFVTSNLTAMENKSHSLEALLTQQNTTLQNLSAMLEEVQEDQVAFNITLAELNATTKNTSPVQTSDKQEVLLTTPSTTRTTGKTPSLTAVKTTPTSTSLSRSSPKANKVEVTVGVTTTKTHSSNESVVTHATAKPSTNQTVTSNDGKSPVLPNETRMHSQRVVDEFPNASQVNISLPTVPLNTTRTTAVKHPIGKSKKHSRG